MYNLQYYSTRIHRIQDDRSSIKALNDGTESVIIILYPISNHEIGFSDIVFSS